jgi:hypothetical protein
VRETKKCMYGSRDAANRWASTYVQALAKHDFEQGKASPCCFKHRSRDLQVVVHGDDFTVVGTDEDLDHFQELIQAEFEVKARGRLGSSKKDCKEIRILNRIVRWTPEGVTCEADQRHVEILVKEMGLCTASSVATPGVKERAGEHEKGSSQELDRAGARMFRSCAARANYLAQGRVDIGYACKEVCREMAKPTEAGCEKLKRIVRYLSGQLRLLYVCRWHTKSDLTVYVDTDWAGFFTTRRSSSGGPAVIGTHLIKHWCTTQATVALSSGEAELGRIVKGSASIRNPKRGPRPRSGVCTDPLHRLPGCSSHGAPQGCGKSPAPGSVRAVGSRCCQSGQVQGGKD